MEQDEWFKGKEMERKQNKSKNTIIAKQEKCKMKGENENERKLPKQRKKT